MAWRRGGEMRENFPPGTIAVIFMSKRSDADVEGYAAAADDMRQAAERFPGYVGIWSARGADGVGITVSYWANEDAARAWKADAAHAAIREQGRAKWYHWYDMAIAEVTRSYAWQRPKTSES
jgi:heme-degrading monooxygenase HmoA